MKTQRLHPKLLERPLLVKKIITLEMIRYQKSAILVVLTNKKWRNGIIKK